ncbi:MULTISPECIES: hypothetical protein [unclassified Luteimonas]
MKFSSTCCFAAMLSVGVCASAMPAQADAATVERAYVHNGGSACTGALPTYEGALRKRPKAIANEGASIAFVTCSAVWDDANPSNPFKVAASVTNRGTAAATLSCTFVNGNEFYGSVSTPATISVPAGGFSVIGWDPVLPATQFPFSAASISCALRPGMEINYFGQQVHQEVGL